MTPPAAGGASPARSLRAWFAPLHVKLTLVALALMLLAGLLLAALSIRHAERMALESTQRLNLGLARDILKHQPRPLVGDDGRADEALVRDLATMVMKINPSVEVYVLNPEGRILAHALEGPTPQVAQVDLGRVHGLLDTSAEMLPMLADDPRQAGRSTIVSVAPIVSAASTVASNDAAAPRGFLYVVLQGLDHQAARATFNTSNALRGAATGIALVLLGAGLVFALALAKLTQPLRRLAAEVESFRRDEPDSGDALHAGATDESGGADFASGGVAGVAPGVAPGVASISVDAQAPPLASFKGGDEVSRLAQATAAMRARIAEQFRRLEDNDRTRRELIGNISHDLHTPLASVQGYLETVLLRGEALDPTTREQHLRTALAHSRRLDRRIADLFELSKLDAGRVQPQVEAFCLAELLQDVIQSYRLTAQQRSVQLELDVGSHARGLVRADIALIERVLQNLVDNALHHTPAGGRVQLSVREQDRRHLMLGVSDTGCGIAPEHLPHVFERYWRAEDARAGDAPARSAGLGLAIVKRIVELHGSAVRVRSVPTQGTTFEFALPQATAA